MYWMYVLHLIMQSIAHLGACFFSGAIKYTLFLEGNKGMIKNVSSDHCANGSCSITFYASTPICHVDIVARNEHGMSSMSSSNVG